MGRCSQVDYVRVRRPSGYIGKRRVTRTDRSPKSDANPASLKDLVRWQFAQELTPAIRGARKPCHQSTIQLFRAPFMAFLDTSSFICFQPDCPLLQN